MISIRKIYPADCGEWERVERLYADAFPRNERRAESEMRRLAECGRLNVFTVVNPCAAEDAGGADGADCTGRAVVAANAANATGTDGRTVAVAGECSGTVGSTGNVAGGGEFCGFITWWDFGGFVYGEHFAMLPECRGAGIGGEVIDRFVADAGKPVVLEVELPTNDLARRRIGFYERHGFVLCDAEYVQPPYDAGGGCVPMRLMSHGMSLDEETFERVRNILYAEVYGVAE